MAAAAKAIGGVLTVLGVLGILAGLAVAAYGLYDADQQRHNVFRDQDREDMDKALVVGGGATAAGGLVLFLAGLITLLTSRPKPLPGPPAPAPTPAMPVDAPDDPGKGKRTAKAEGPGRAVRTPLVVEPPADDRMRRNAIVGGTVAMILVAFLVAAVFYVQSGNTSPFWGDGNDTPVTTFDEWRNGTMQAGALVPGTDPIYTDDGNVGSFTVPPTTRSCTLSLAWTKGTGGADQLRLEVTRDGQQVAEAQGTPGFTMQVEGEGLAGAAHDFAVLHDGNPGFVNQPFQLHVLCVR